jgi:hypothetical protein
VLENRQRLAATLGVDLSQFVVANQVHDGDVAVVTSVDRSRGALSDDTAIPAADALVSAHTETVLAVMVADCVPVIVFDPSTPAAGIAHAGWKGTVAHVTRNTVETMAREFGTDPVHYVAAIGPSIGPDSYEVGPEVAEQARAAFPDADVIREHYGANPHFDLWASNTADLLSAGLRRENIDIAAIDTLTDPRFFSHRRRAPTGRFMAFAGLRPS